MKHYPEIVRLLEASGLEWRTESGSNHIKLFIAGRMVQVLPRTGGSDRRRDLNAICAIRRAIRAHTQAAAS